MNKFSVRLKQLRISKNLSHRELALAIGVSNSTVSRWETAQRVPNIDEIAVIAKFFNVTSDYLIGLEDNEI